MTCKIANEISLEVLLTSWGFHKIKKHRGGDEFFYDNPIREDTTPSFLINIKKNVWVDFGLIPNAGQKAKGGKVVDLIMEMQKTDVKGALDWLRNNTNNIDIQNIKNRIKSTPYIEPEARFKFKNSKPIFSYFLKDYLKKRHIDLSIAKEHVMEIRFFDSYKKNVLSGIGFKNNSGGYNIRNAFGKTILAPNDIKYIPSNSKTSTLLLFEGMWDYLSYLMIKNTSVLDDDVIIQNTLSFTRRSIEYLNKLPHIKNIVSFLDNPKNEQKSIDAMNSAIELLLNSGKNIQFANQTFLGFEDLAAYWEETNSRGPIILKNVP